MTSRTKYGVFLLLVMISGLLLYRLFYPPYARERALPPAISSTAAALTDSFDKAEARADTLYLGKIVSVTGVLTGMHKNGQGQYVVTLAGRYSGKTAVDCYLDSFYTADRLNIGTGSTVTILGRCAGRSLNVLLVQCIVVKPSL